MIERPLKETSSNQEKPLTEEQIWQDIIWGAKIFWQKCHPFRQTYPRYLFKPDFHCLPYEPVMKETIQYLEKREKKESGKKREFLARRVAALTGILCLNQSRPEAQRIQALCLAGTDIRFFLDRVNQKNGNH